MSLSDDEFSRLLAARTAATDQLESELAGVAGTLAKFRTQLIVHGFSTGSAEELTLEWFVRILDGPASSEDD